MAEVEWHQRREPLDISFGRGGTGRAREERDLEYCGISKKRKMGDPGGTGTVVTTRGRTKRIQINKEGGGIQDVFGRGRCHFLP